VHLETKKRLTSRRKESTGGIHSAARKSRSGRPRGQASCSIFSFGNQNDVASLGLHSRIITALEEGGNANMLSGRGCMASEVLEFSFQAVISRDNLLNSAASINQLSACCGQLLKFAGNQIRL